MPWRETSPVEERERFIKDLRHGLFTMPELCQRYGISRKTGYKWAGRYEERGWDGLVDRSRAPKTCPHRIDALVGRMICDVRRKHPSWGPFKILQYLEPRYPEIEWPAISTMGDLLIRRGLVKKRRRRRKHPHPGTVPGVTEYPNDIWTADFKGQFKLGAGVYCFPLTIADQHTRYLLSCWGLLDTKTVGARRVFERMFYEYGIPKAIRTDNGVPFATSAVHGLSSLNVWWLRLGIEHQRIRPASPQENGRHERMHRTLKAETTRPPKATLSAQQRAFDRFREIYNEERPHQALNGQTPASQYRPSNREYNGSRLPPFEYPGHYIIKRITNAGTLKLQGKLLYLSTALRQQLVGLEEVDDGVWSIWFCRHEVARVSERDWRIQG
jgi:transposase InsO family protein